MLCFVDHVEAMHIFNRVLIKFVKIKEISLIMLIKDALHYTFTMFKRWCLSYL